MIISIEEARRFVDTKETDQALGDRLQALECMIRSYTHNNFQQRAFRSVADVVNGDIKIRTNAHVFRPGDTIEISDSSWNNGLYLISAIEDETAVCEGSFIDERCVLITKVVYPADVVMGVVNMLKWDLNNRSKVGIKSETLSRHSVTYYDMDSTNSAAGYPKSLLGFLKPYMKARF